MTFCLQRSIPIVLLSSKGNYYGMIDSPLADRVSLQQRQFQRAADSSFTLVTGKGLVRAKLANCRVLLQRHQRRRKLSAVQEVIVELESLSTRLGDAQTLDEVRGFEGRGAASYFEALGHLLVKNPGFDHRARRPPTDPVNSLLSFGYTLCFYNIFALIRARGLHPGVGFLHALRDGHPGLASDLLEEFRAPIVDGLVLQLFNTCAIKPTDFYRPSGPEPRPCLLRDPARKIFLEYFERRMVSSLIHPRTKESLDWRRVMDVQVAHMVQWIRGEVTEYLPLEIR